MSQNYQLVINCDDWWYTSETYNELNVYVELGHIFGLVKKFL